METAEDSLSQEEETPPPEADASPIQREGSSDGEYLYDAFLCYRRLDATPFTLLLYWKLRFYRLPEGLLEERPRIRLRIFLDRFFGEITKNFFDEEIIPALENSHYLILVCTPGALAARSGGQPSWLTREVEHFVKLGRADRIAVVVAKGEMEGSLPGDLHKSFPQIERVDLRRFSAVRLLPPFSRWDTTAEFLKLVAALHEIPSEKRSELNREEAQIRTRSIRRWSIAVTTLALIFASLLIFALVAWDRAWQAQQKEAAALRVSNRNVADSMSLLAGAARQEGDDLEALLYLSRARRHAVTPRWISEMLSLQHPLAVFDRSLEGQTAWPAAFRPDNSLLAIGRSDGTVYFYDPIGKRRLGEVPGDLPVLALAFSGDGDRMALVRRAPADAAWNPVEDSRSRLDLYDLSGPQPYLLRSLPPPNPESGFLAVSLDGSGSRILAGTDTETLLWDIRRSSKPLASFPGKSVTSVALTQNGQLCAAGSWQGWVRVWDVASHRLLHEKRLPPPSDRTYPYNSVGVAFNPSGNLLASGSYDGSVEIWDLTSSKAQILRGHTDAVTSVAFSRDGHFLASGSWDQTARIWDLREAKSLARIHGAAGAGIQTVAFSADGRSLATTEAVPMSRSPLGGEWRYGPVRIWSLSPDRASMVSLPGTPLGVRFEQDGDLSAWSLGPRLQLWTEGASKTLMELSGKPWSPLVETLRRKTPVFLLVAANQESATSTGEVFQSAGIAGTPIIAASDLSPEGDLLAIVVGRVGGSGDRISEAQLRLVPLRPGEPARSLPLSGELGVVGPLRFSPDGSRLALVLSEATGSSTAGGAQVRIWDKTGDEIVPPLNGEGSSFCSIAFSPDGASLAAGACDGELQVWDLARKTRKSLRLPAAGTAALVDYSPDGNYLVGLSFGQIERWETDTWRSRSGPFSTAFIPTCLDLSPDGNVLVTGGYEGQVTIWDLHTLEALGAIPAHTGAVAGLSFSPDGTRMASLGPDGMKIWGGFIPRDDTEASRLSRLRLGAGAANPLSEADERRVSLLGQVSLTPGPDPDAAEFWRLWRMATAAEAHWQPYPFRPLSRLPAEALRLAEWSAAHERHPLAPMANSLLQSFGSR